MRIVFLGHFAVGLAAKRAAPSVSLATWFLSVQLVDFVWPLFLLTGVEEVRIQPGITAFTPLDFSRYPVTHSLVGGLAWAAVLAGVWLTAATVGAVRRGETNRSDWRVAALLAGGVLSHWVLDAVSHRPDVPVLPHGPYVGLGLWNSVPATLVVELSLFVAGIAIYVKGGAPGARRGSFWALIALLFVIYLASAFGPPPPDVRTLAVSCLALWLILPFAWFADRPARTVPSIPRSAPQREA